MSWPSSATLLAPLAPWFDGNRRELPWRAADLDAAHPDPYAVLVSELMLQQTQVATVLPYFTRWMDRWPTVEALAAASDEEVHKAWEGLGYYRRARLLHAGAKRIAGEGWPSDLAGLRGIPGLGDYTAAALAAQAFRQPEAALDGNAFRVLARLLGLAEDPRPRARELRDWLRPALAALGPSRLTQALMELGATVCAPLPRCGGCPVADRCAALRLEATGRIPPARPRAQPAASEFWLAAVEADGRWLLAEPAGKGLLAGLWRWPSTPLPETGADAAAEPAGTCATVELSAWPGWTQVYTHRRERVHPLRIRLQEGFDAPAGFAWTDPGRLGELPMGRRDSRLRELLPQPGEAPLLPVPLGLLLGGLRRGGSPSQ